MNPVLSPDQVQLLYETLDLFHQTCERLQLRYTITGGAALGAKRHGGLIPWDDDADVGVYATVEEMDVLIQELSQYASVYVKRSFWAMQSRNISPFLKCRPPFLDIWRMIQFPSETRWRFHNGEFSSQWTQNDEVSLVPYGPLRLYMTTDPNYLQRAYGEDCMHSVCVFNHTNKGKRRMNIDLRTHPPIPALLPPRPVRRIATTTEVDPPKPFIGSWLRYLRTWK